MFKRCYRPAAMLLFVLIAGCASSPTSASPPGGTDGPAVIFASSTAALPAQRTTVTLPTPAASADSWAMTFPAMPTATSVALTVADGPSSVAVPQAAAIWAPSCPWPLETIGLTFANNEQLSSTPSLTFTTPRIQGTPTYYDSVLADATLDTIVAQQKAAVSVDTAADSGQIPSMKTAWNVVAGHQYVIEIVASTSAFLSCSGTYN